MKMNEYQEKAMEYATHRASLTYAVLGLSGEAGEVAEKYKKVLRDDAGVITHERRVEIKRELGDVLWYVSCVAKHLGFTLEQIAQENVKKLGSRAARGALQGSGDNR